jgi:NTP pyrophosphatase (non-canonical NTP hydrolase)
MESNMQEERDHYNYPLTMNDYQADMASTAIYKWKIIYPALGLANEAGEVLGKIKKLIRDSDLRFDDGYDQLSDEQRAAISAELGDVLWYVAALSRDLGVPLNDVAHMNLEKLKSRQARGTLGGSGDNR